MSSQKHFTLILLYDKMVASLPVAQALKEKGIDVSVSQNAGELIQIIASKNVDMVGLSANHASSRSLIQVLREKTSVKILIFGEDKTLTTVERIDRMDADFKVQGVATAYNIWMKIAHVVKSKMKESDNNGNILYSGGKSSSNNDNQSIAVKSTSSSSKTNLSGATNIFSKKKKDKKQKEKQNEELETIEISDFQKKSEKQSDVMFFKKDSKEISVDSHDEATEELSAKSGKKGSPFKKSSLKKSKEKSEEQLIDDEVSAVEQMFKDPFQKKSRDIVSPDVEASSPLKQGGVTVSNNAQAESSGSIRDSELDEMMKEESLGTVQDLSAVGTEDIGSVQFDQTKKQKFKGKKLNSAKQNKEEAFSEEVGRQKVEFKQLVESAAHSAYVSKESGIDSFGAINKMTVVPVDQNQDRGFLVFCTSDNQFLTSGGTTVDVFKKSLQEKMHHQDAMGIGESYNIETEEIELLGWVPSASEFHFIVEDPKSQKQILICFIPKESIYPDTNKSIELNMLKVELEVLPTRTPLNFNVFLYFARNKRLIPYVRRGGRLTDDQLGRLNKHGIDTIYISESDRKALYSFFISQTLHQDFQPIKKVA